MRTIELQITRAQHDAVIQALQASLKAQLETLLEDFDQLDRDEGTRAQYRKLSNINPGAEFNAAIGRLAGWSLPDEGDASKYTHCVIHCTDTDSPELTAVYKSACGKRTFVLGAVWHGVEWGFHS